MTSPATTLLVFATTLLLLMGCASSPVTNKDWAYRANEHLASQDGTVTSNPERDARLEHLWSDNPEYIALIKQKTAKSVRVLSNVSPKCPDSVRGTRFRVIVEVSFIVGLDGKVEDARILESPDPRFDSASIEAIRQFRFVPAQGLDGGPQRRMVSMKFIFAGHGVVPG